MEACIPVLPPVWSSSSHHHHDTHDPDEGADTRLHAVRGAVTHQLLPLGALFGCAGR